MPLNELLQLALPADAALEWDVQLSLANSYKTHVRATDYADANLLKQLLLTPFPRFIWRTTLCLNGQKLVEVMFDATGLARSFPFHFIVWHEESFALVVVKILEMSELQDVLRKMLSEEYIDFLTKSVRQQVTS